MRPHSLSATKHARQGVAVYEVDIQESTWFGKSVSLLGAHGRRKFENWVVLERPKERIKIIYV